MKTRIEIPKSCDQDWNKMTILEKGRFCMSCNKTVTDFTNQSQKDIIQKINGKKEVCGRFYSFQLQEINMRNNKKPDLYVAKWAVLLGLGSILGITEPVIAKNTKPKIELQQKSNWKSILPQKTKKDTITIKGKVLDFQSELPLSGVNVVVEGTIIGTQTNFDGEFSIAIPIDKLDEENYLVFSYLGFEDKKYKFNKTNKLLNINLKLEADEEMISSGPVVIAYKLNIFDKIGNFFKNLFSKKTGH